jgi:8-oxo-dGTP pyrophosphatase MutT (NUDIX family)
MQAFFDRHIPSKTWVRNLRERFTSPKFRIVGEPDVKTVIPFGPLETAAAGFTVAVTRIEYTRADGSTGIVPGAALLRGPAVAILVLLRDSETGEDHVLLTVQPRVPIADPAFMEIPAGMLDGSSNFAGKAAAELREETGIVIAESRLERLGAMTPSAGGCDEQITLYLYRDTMTPSELAALRGKATGVLEENEDITLALLPLSELRAEVLKEDTRITDGKLLSALAFYHMRH